MQGLFKYLRAEIRGSWRYRWKAMITAWVICSIGWLFVLKMPDVFEAKAQVYVDADSRLADVIDQVGVSPGVGSRVFVVRQAMLGTPQLNRVARETGLDLRAETEGEKVLMLEGLRKKIVVGTGRSRETQNLYTISFVDGNRRMAIAVVQELLDTFVEDVLRLKDQGTADVTNYLEDQLNHYSGLLSTAEKSLAGFKTRYVGLLPGESGGVFDRLQAELEALTVLRSNLQIQEDRRLELRRQLQSETPYVTDDGASSTGTAVPGSVTQATIAELEARRSELLLTFTARHPDVVAINEQLQQLYAKSSEDRAAMAASNIGLEGVGNSTNPVYQSIQIALNEASVGIAGLHSEINQGESNIRHLRGQIDTIPEIEAEYAELNRNYDQYRSLYNELLLRKERERLGSVGDDQDVVSFNIVDPPSAAIDPIAPKRVLLLAAVLVMGLGAGGALAFLLHQLNPVFHDSSALRAVTGRPVLGVVSMTWLERKRLGRRVDFSSFAIAGISLIAVFAVTILLKDQLVLVLQTSTTQVIG